MPSPDEVAFYDWLDIKLAMSRGKNQPVPPRTKRPWEKPREVTKATWPVDSERRQKLMERLGLGGVVDADDQPDGQPQPEGDDGHEQMEAV